MAGFKLTYYNITGLAEPIRYIFAVAGVPYEDIRIPRDDTTYPILPPEIKDKLPWGKIPILEFEGKTLSETGVICRYLARKFNLAGSDDFEAAKCGEISDALKDFGDELQSLMQEKDAKAKGEKFVKVRDVLMPKLMGKLSSILEENSGKWLVGAKLTWIDLVFAHFVTIMAQRSKMDVTKGYLVLENHVKAVYAIPQIKEWIEKRPQTEETDFSLQK